MYTFHSKPILHVGILISLLISLIGGALVFRSARAAADTVGTCNETTLTSTIASASPNDTIIFSCDGTITLSNTITIGKNLTIDGTGHTVIINGDNNVQVMTLNGSSSLTLKDITIENGECENCNGSSSVNGGGGIFNNGGTLTIIDSTFTDNKAECDYNYTTCTNNSKAFFGGGAIYNASGTLNVTQSTFSGNVVSCTGTDTGLMCRGGAIFNYGGTLTVTQSTFFDNQALCANGNGTVSQNCTSGGLYQYSTNPLIITGSTFDSNTSFWPGGAVSFEGSSAPTVTITNSSFWNNSVSGMAVNGQGCSVISAGMASLTLINSTLSGNLNPMGGNGAICTNASYPATIKNTILVNNNNGNCFRTETDGGNNIEDGDSCGFALTSNGSMKNTAPLLGPLADNGGPTKTFALLAGSPAIDGVTYNGTNGAPSTDQRGIWRPVGPHDDIGAYEKGWDIFLPMIIR